MFFIITILAGLVALIIVPYTVLLLLCMIFDFLDRAYLCGRKARANKESLDEEDGGNEEDGENEEDGGNAEDGGNDEDGETDEDDGNEEDDSIKQ
jgi:hypothetical protein